MSLDTYATYIAAVLLLMSTPGPSQILMLSNSLANGFSRSVATAAGDLTANSLQMLIATVGLAGLIHASGDFFFFVKWAGVAYLLFVGLRQFFTRTHPAGLMCAQQRSLRSLYGQGFVTSAANPKAIVFFAALFPQFIDPALSIAPQFVILSLTYLIIDGVLLMFYGRFAGWVARRWRTFLDRHLNQVSGALLSAAAALLAFKRVESQ